MDLKLKQALIEAVGRVLEIIQSAGGNPDMNPDQDSGMNPDQDKGMNPSQPNMNSDQDLDMDPDEGMPGELPPEDQGLPPTGRGDDATGGSLHDRVTKLESHTGLRKSARGLSMAERIDALERHYLGEEYDGDIYKRVAQLEKVAGQNAAPDVIPLEEMIKSAVQEGIRQGLAIQQQTLPDIDRSRYQGSQRRAQASVVKSDEDLRKAAQAWGYTDEDLDAPVSLGDSLLYQWYVNQGGQALPADALDED